MHAAVIDEAQRLYVIRAECGEAPWHGRSLRAELTTDKYERQEVNRFRAAIIPIRIRERWASAAALRHLRTGIRIANTVWRFQA